MSGGGGGGGRSKRGRAPLGEINVTPLVDVMLVLLIIFMVAAPMITTGISVDLPRAEARVIELDESKLLLTITNDEKVFLGDAEVPFDRLEQALLANERLQREDELYVYGDSEVRYGFVVRVFGILQKAGIDKIGIVTNPLSSGETEAGAGAPGAAPPP
jgi:biopolymer transport protein TolR